MSTKSFFTILLLLSGVSFTSSAQLKIRLFNSTKPGSLLAEVEEGGFRAVIDGSDSFYFTGGDMIYLNTAGEKILGNSRSGRSFVADSISFEDTIGNSLMNLSTDLHGNGEKPAGSYEGSFSIVNRYGKLMVLNLIDEERYVAAVVQAEGGYKGHPSYLMTQAILVRTYTMLHLKRHEDEGYNLCDDVHCQAYRGRSVTESIDRAVEATHGLVVTGPDSIIVLTPFHSNCGGETMPSEWVWLTAQPHLVPVIDPYCRDSRNALWEKKLPIEEWTEYIGLSDSAANNGIQSLAFRQETRKEFYRVGDLSVPLENIRRDMNLKSTFFSVNVIGDSILLSGRGYGHGVGLCQEGAMVMAARGFSWEQIIRFYFKGVIILDKRDAKLPGSIDQSF